MGNRANVIRVWGDTTKTSYVHYDGYPDNMLEQLAHIRPSDIMKKGGWASLDHNGHLDVSNHARKTEYKVPGVGIALKQEKTRIGKTENLDDHVADILTNEYWIEYVYVLTGKNTVEVYDGENVTTHDLRDIRKATAAKANA